MTAPHNFIRDFQVEFERFNLPLFDTNDIQAMKTAIKEGGENNNIIYPNY